MSAAPAAFDRKYRFVPINGDTPAKLGFTVSAKTRFWREGRIMTLMEARG